MEEERNPRADVPDENDVTKEESAAAPAQQATDDDFILSGDLSGTGSVAGEPGGDGKDGEQNEMTVDVVRTVTRLEELNRLLGELNFRELIVQFGKVQGDLELIRYELDGLREESGRVWKALSDMGVFEPGREADSSELAGTLRERMNSLVSDVRELLSRQEILNNYVANSRGWLLERSGDALDALTRIRDAQNARMKLVDSLNEMLESDAPNETLASAALEFAVLMRELDAGEGVEKLDTVISEISGFRDEVERAENLVLTDAPDTDGLNESLVLAERLPGMTGELFSFLKTVSDKLKEIEAGWNGAQSDTAAVPDEAPSADSDG